MKLKVSAGGVPAGSYVARFDGIEEMEHEKYGAGLRWKFAILDGPQAGQIACRTTGTTPTAKNGCGKALGMVVGRSLAVDEEIDLDPYVGRRFMIVVQEAEGGGTRVEAVLPAQNS